MISRGGKGRPGRICQVGVIVPRVIPIYLHVCVQLTPKCVCSSHQNECAAHTKMSVQLTQNSVSGLLLPLVIIYKNSC